MSKITSDTLFEHTPWVVVRPQKDNYLFYNSRTDELHLIPATGHAAYTLCDGLRTIDDITSELSDVIIVEPDVLQQRVTEFLAALETRGLLARADRHD
ncbi:PqqD family protein [Rhodopseudomonas pseudopalustris]|uniref:Coenzyme PQQ synthesis protein D (PqqD) n=1 Tax=Rhodopseudomonas pseudopalustris TaxID=1513892 RepID=A0A1H8LYL1_9BRAD|nr:PqqD family protein [Rhodopseudomonas pseudopalustris]SEO10234.1 Coenzyme PQQ synthesis protein D (PqqD) [Rhodopseudomonas pseudopalustris]